MAVGAFDVLKHCEVFSTLSEALEDISLAVGTTSGQSRSESPAPLLTVAPLAMHTSQKQLVAFVFGDERDGLTRAELARCHRIITIPTNPDFPALNVAQAVGIIAYELTRIESASGAEVEKARPTGRADDQLFVQMDEMLDRIQFTRKYNRQVILQELRALYQRMYPSEREADILHGILRRLNQSLSSEQHKSDDKANLGARPGRPEEGGDE